VNLRHLEFVIAVADEGGFRRAAASLHVSQSALSHAIAAIEDRLGEPLFNRTGRRVSLTPLGETYVAAGRDVLAAQQAMELTVAGASHLDHAPLTVVVQATSVVGAATTLLTAMRARHPGVRLEVVSRPTADAVDAELLEGRCEVGISDWASHRSLVVEHLFEERFWLACPPGTEVGPDTLRPSDRFPTPMILPRGWRQLRAAAEHDEGYDLDNEVAVETDARDLLLPLVLGGVGAAMVPEPFARVAAAAGAVVVPIDPPLTRPVLLVHRPGRLSTVAQVFIAVARQVAARQAEDVGGSDLGRPIEPIDHREPRTALDGGAPGVEDRSPT
jgi:LysR family carnitine catabolism transcriptional activator